MATQEIGIEYEGHQVIVPYDVVVLIVHAKETAGFPFQPYTTLVDKYIADIIKSYAADRNSEDGCYDYRALMNGFEVLKIWARVLEKGGIRNCYPDQTLKPAAAIFKELNDTIQKMAPVRGYDAVDHLLFRKLRSQWKKAWDDEEDFLVPCFRLRVESLQRYEVYGKFSIILQCFITNHAKQIVLTNEYGNSYRIQ